GTCLRPSWTAIVWPTNDGKMVERRDHVLMTRFSFDSFSLSIFFIRWSSAKGPFFKLRPIDKPPFRVSGARIAPVVQLSLAFTNNIFIGRFIALAGFVTHSRFTPW